MGKFLSRALTGAIVFAYGLFTIFLYGVISLAKGTYFKRPTEKEKLELQLGEIFSSDVSVKDSLTTQLVIVSGTYRKTLRVFPIIS